MGGGFATKTTNKQNDLQAGVSNHMLPAWSILGYSGLQVEQFYNQGNQQAEQLVDRLSTKKAKPNNNFISRGRSGTRRCLTPSYLLLRGQHLAKVVCKQNNFTTRTRKKQPGPGIRSASKTALKTVCKWNTLQPGRPASSWLTGC